MAPKDFTPDVSGPVVLETVTADIAPTGTGLDAIVAGILADPGLNKRVADAEIVAGAEAAAVMNAIIVEGIKATGIANNGGFTAGDIAVLAEWVQANRYAPWLEAHGDDEADVETGFHLVQNDGAVLRQFGDNAVNTVADGLYHLGFGHEKGRLLNEDGDANATLEQAAFWLTEILAEDLAAGTLANPAIDLYPGGTTGTALDEIVDAIVNDPTLTRRYTSEELAEIARDADKLNAILLEAVEATGAGEDGKIDTVDLLDMSHWIKTTKSAEWAALRGDQDDDIGVLGLVWHGTETQVAGANAVDGVARGLYSLGHEVKWSSIYDEDGDWAGSTGDAVVWLNTLLADELADGTFDRAAEDAADPAAMAAALVVDPDVAVSVRERDGYLEIADTGDLSLPEGTVTLTFVMDDPYGRGTQVIFSKDGAGSNEGDLRAYVRNGELKIKTSTGGEDAFITVPVGIEAHTAYDLAISFGGEGLSVWLDGAKVATRPELTVNWAQNDSDIIVGASNGHQEAGGKTKITSHFQGEVQAFKVYDRQLDRAEIEAAGGGVTITGDEGDNDIAGSVGNDALNGGLGGDVMLGGDGHDVMKGGYGGDLLEGGNGNDVLDGGHGIDILNGGDGNDILLSTGDAREPVVAQLYVGPNGVPEDESGFASDLGTGVCPATGAGYCQCAQREELNTPDPDNELDPVAKKLYPDQPLPAEDILTGGAGADIFRFQTEINAKYEIILKHVRDDGSINWAGVAGENDELHDHWVESIGHDTITDFDRKEGDRIEIAGHTTEIASITYEDSDGDGEEDYSIIWLISNQGGNGGAHDQDLLGTITVLDTIVRAKDITLDSAPTYGIVETIDQIAEAITPLEVSEIGPREKPADLIADADPVRDNGPGDPVAAALGDGQTKAGDGLTGQVWNVATSLHSLAEFDKISQEAPTHMVAVSKVDLGEKTADTASLADFLGSDGEVTSGNPNAAMEMVGMKLTGFVYIPPGMHTIAVKSDDGFRLKIGGEELIAFTGQRGYSSTGTVFDFGEGGLFEIELDYFENRGAQRVSLVLDGEVMGADSFFTSVEAFETAGPAMPEPSVPLTGTAFDALVDMIIQDEGLMQSLTAAEIMEAAEAADDLNALLLAAIAATGVANDGTFTEYDIVALNDWIAETVADLHRALHGEDTKTGDSGFEIVDQWFTASPIYGTDGISTIADAIYSIGFGVKHGHSLQSETGGWSASLEDVATWMNALLAEDLASGAYFVEAFATTDPAVFAGDIVVSYDGVVTADGSTGYVDVAHTGAQALPAGTVSLTFRLDEVPAEQTVGLFSKDAKHFGEGGHMTAYVWDGILHVRIQSEEKSAYLRLDPETKIEAGEDYHLAVTFGPDGAAMFVNGEKVDVEQGIDYDWTGNGESTVIGGSAMYRSDKHPDNIVSVMDGEIFDFAVYDRVLHQGEINGLAGRDVDVTPASGDGGTSAPVPPSPPPAPEVPEGLGDGVTVGTERVGQDSADQWHSVTFDEAILDAVVIMGPVSAEGDQPVVTRVRNVTETGFEFQLDEWEYLDGYHFEASVSWIAASAGDYMLDDGRNISFGKATGEVGSGTRIKLDGFDDAPVVMVQRAEEAVDVTLTDRVFDVRSDSFAFALQAEEALADEAYADEAAYWMAIEAGGTGLAAGIVSPDVTHEWTETNVNAEAHFLADMQTIEGSNTAALRYDTDATGVVSLQVQEERSADDEAMHRPERVAWLTAESDWYNLTAV